jgi:PAT family beta-lactamase induction signal transducer AmpG
MITLAGNRLARTATLCALYCAQGMPWGFVTITLLAYIAEQGAGLEETAKIMSLATLPWSFKVIWGLVIDRFTFRAMGRRRPWVLLAQLGIGASLLLLILIDDLSANVETMAWMVFVHNCFVSLQDVSTDALAVDMLTDDERGRVNGFMWASNNLGAAIGGAGMGTVLAHFGLQAAFMLQVSVLFAVALFPLLIRERLGERLMPWSKGEANLHESGSTTESFLALIRKLTAAFRTRAPAVGVVFAFSSTILVGMMVATNPVFFTQELGFSQERYSQITGGIGALAGVLGALAGGFLVDIIGMRRIYTVSALILVMLCAGMGFSADLRGSTIYCVIYLLCAEFLISAQIVAGFSMFMRLCTIAVAGTQFTLYMAVSNLARVGGAGMVSSLKDNGYGSIFLVMGATMLLSIPILFAIPEPRKEPVELGA